MHCRFGYAGLPWTNFVSIDDDGAYSPPNAVITNSPFAQMGYSLHSAAWGPVCYKPNVHDMIGAAYRLEPMLTALPGRNMQDGIWPGVQSAFVLHSALLPQLP